MMTQTHMLLGIALLGKPKAYGRNIAALMGGVVPDAAIFVMYGWEKAKGVPSATIWNDIYFNSEYWKNAVAWGNSAPLYILILLLGCLTFRFNKMLGAFVSIFSLSSLLHIAADFFLHVEDAHRHFFPISNYKFISPVSYWDPQHYGNYWSAIEMVMALCLCAWLFTRYKSAIARSLLGIVIAAYIAVPIYFSLSI